MEEELKEIEVESDLELESRILTPEEEAEEIHDEHDFIALAKEAAIAKQIELINTHDAESKQELEVEIYEINETITAMQEAVEANEVDGGQITAVRPKN